MPQPTRRVASCGLEVPRVVLAGVGVTVLLAVVYLGFTEVNRVHTFYFLYGLFDLNGEANVPTWFSALQLAVAGILVGVVAAHLGRVTGMVSPGAAAAWLLAAFLVAMSIDETVGLHEWFGRTIERLMPAAREVTGLRHTGPWMLILGPIALGVVALGVWFGRRHVVDYPQAKPAAFRFLAGLGVMLGAAIGAEILVNFVAGDFHPLTPSRPWAIMITFEEVGEMLGGTLMIWGAIDLLRAHGLRLTTDHDQID
jgi:hypothetical protein